MAPAAGRDTRRAFVRGVAVGLVCAGLAGFAAWLLRPQPPATPVQIVTTFSRAEDEPAAPPPAQAESPVPEPVVTPPPPAPEAPPKPSAAERYAAEYPVFPKLASRPLSSEPHQVLGAWDEDENVPEPGQRRAFVLTVSPGQSDASLEALARDVRERNLDALVLDVRIYDDAGAALAPRMLDSGQTSRQHLVAEVKRNPAASLDSIRVRGRAVEP